MDPPTISAVKRLLTDAEQFDRRPPLSDHLWVDLLNGGRPGFVGVIATDGRSPHPGSPELPIAYAQASRANSSWMLELVVAPAHRDQLVGIGRELIAAALRVIADDGGGRVDWWVFEPTPAHDELASVVGLRPQRSLDQMRRHLPTEERPTIVTRAFVPGADEEAWLAVNNRAFAGHPDQGGWDRETLLQREREPWFDPAGFLVHERDGRLAGFCWTKLHLGHDPPLGEIYVIGVDPDFHGHGLGKQLTLAGLDSLARRGIAVGMLYVDTANTVGLKLYDRLGFTRYRTDRAYVGQV